MTTKLRVNEEGLLEEIEEKIEEEIHARNVEWAKRHAKVFQRIFWALVLSIPALSLSGHPFLALIPLVIVAVVLWIGFWAHNNGYQ